jgi:WD40 repeat protein
MYAVHSVPEDLIFLCTIFDKFSCCLVVFGSLNHLTLPSIHLFDVLYCFYSNPVSAATFDRTGRYVITGSDDRLVKIWAMETAFCLASCRGHEVSVTYYCVFVAYI